MINCPQEAETLEQLSVFLDFAPFLPQISLSFGPICWFSHVPYKHKIVFFFYLLFFGLKKKCFAENQISLIHLILCNILLFWTPYNSIKSIGWSAMKIWQLRKNRIFTCCLSSSCSIHLLLWFDESQLWWTNQNVHV